MDLLEAQPRHHGTDVVAVQILAEGWVAANLLQNFRGVAELDVLQWGIRFRNPVVLQNLLFGIVCHHEETVVVAHLVDVLTGEPEGPVLSVFLAAAHHLLAQCQSLGIDVLIVYRMVYRTIYALYNPWRIAAVLLVGDKLLTVGCAAERSTVGQFATVLVVGTADGEGELREVALEGTQVLAEDGLELIETDHRLAAECLHEVLVGITGSGIVEEILAQLWGQEVGKEGGLENAALAYEDEDELVDYLR